MNDIITADNFPLVIGAIFTGIAGLAVYRQAGKLGDEAKHIAPPSLGAPTAGGGLAITNDGAKQIAEPLVQIAAVLTEWWTATKHYREAKTEETQEELLERMRSLTDPDFVEAIRQAFAAKKQSESRPPRGR